MNRFYSDSVKQALQYEPPGSWMPSLPEGCIRLSAGYPAPSLVPSHALGEAARQLVALEGDLPFQYLGTAGMGNLTRWIRNRLQGRGVAVHQNELLVTSGAYQALDLVAHLLCNRDTPVFVEDPTYMEALEIFHNYTDNIVGIETDAFGLSVDSLSEVLQLRQAQGLPMPRFLYTIASYHNPTGTTLSEERRRTLLQLAEAYDFLIVEDDAYGELSFTTPPTPLKAMDEALRVIHIGSLSKVVGPGLRIGWVMAQSALIEGLGWLKKDLDHPFGEACVAQYLEHVDWDARIAELRGEYRRRRDVLVDALHRFMPSTVSFVEPDGGYFVWIHVPGYDTNQLLERALAAGVAYVPGRFFFREPDAGKEYLRLSFSYLDDVEMRAGVQKLAGVIREEMGIQ